MRTPTRTLWGSVIMFVALGSACETPRPTAAPAVNKSTCSGQPRKVSASALLDAPARHEGQYVEVNGFAYTTTGKRKTIQGMRRWANGEEPRDSDCLTRQWLTPPDEHTSLTRRIDLSDASGVIFCSSRSCDETTAAATCTLPANRPAKARGVFRYDEGLMLATLERCSP